MRPLHTGTLDELIVLSMSYFGFGYYPNNLVLDNSINVKVYSLT